MFKGTDKDLPYPYNRLFDKKESEKDVIEKKETSQDISFIVLIIIALMLNKKDDSLSGYYY